MRQSELKLAVTRVSILWLGGLGIALALAGPFALRGAASAPADPEPQKVTLRTEDKLELAATYFAPRDTRQKAPAAVLIHGAGGARAELQPLALRLQKSGFAVLSLDLRGHGESATADLDWTKLDPEGESRNWAFMPRDVKAGVEFLTSQSGVHATTVSLVGHGAGCALAARHATRDERVRDLVLLAPKTEQQGSTLVKDLVELGGLPTYLVVGKDEAATAKRIAEAASRGAPESGSVETSVSKVETAELLGDPKLPNELARWMQAKALPGGAKGPELKRGKP